MKLSEVQLKMLYKISKQPHISRSSLIRIVYLIGLKTKNMIDSELSFLIENGLVEKITKFRLARCGPTPITYKATKAGLELIKKHL